MLRAFFCKFQPLLTAEMALAVVLLTGAGAMVHSFLNMYTTNLGAGIANIRSMFLHLPEESNLLSMNSSMRGQVKSQDPRIALADNCDPNTFPAGLCAVLSRPGLLLTARRLVITNFHEVNSHP